MAETFRLSPERPHNDDYSYQGGTALSEAVRVLEHATYSGVVYPSAVHNVLGRSSAAAAGLDQMRRQIAETLERVLTSGRPGDDHGAPDEQVDNAIAELTAARETAHILAVHLDHAFNATAGLHLTAEGEG